MTRETAAVRAANAAFPPLWSAGLLQPPELNAERLLDEARTKAGLGEFGDPALPARLERLVGSLNQEAALTPLGRVMSYGGILRALSQRLRAEALIAEHAEIEKRPLAPPVIVVGPMRSGTTRIQRLLACDPRFVHTRLFEALTPCPPAPGEADRRRLAARTMQWSFDRLNPAIRRIHPGGVEDADEELGVLELALSGAQIEAQRPVPSWARWMEQTPQTHAYVWLKRWMQLTGWRRGDDPAKPWLLKTPQYMQDLPAILSVFPDARLIFTHRDPAKIAASAASLAWNYARLQSERATRDWAGAEWRHKTIFRIERAEAFRSARAELSAIDMTFRETNADWRAVIRRIYDWLGWELTPDVLARMQRYTARAASKHLKTPHRYSAREFGLDGAEINERLEGYRARYGLE